MNRGMVMDLTEGRLVVPCSDFGRALSYQKWWHADD